VGVVVREGLCALGGYASSARGYSPCLALPPGERDAATCVSQKGLAQAIWRFAWVTRT
jgi:hypothetical protein